MQQYGNNGRPYDQNRDSLRSSGSSQRTTPPNDGASDTSRYGFNGEPLSRPPARTANGTVRRTRTDNSIEFPTQPRPVRDTGSTARRPAGQRSTAQRPRSSSGQNRRRPSVLRTGTAGLRRTAGLPPACNSRDRGTTKTRSCAPLRSGTHSAGKAAKSAA